MDEDPEFPCQASKENEIVELLYFSQEAYFMADPTFLDDPETRNMRTEAIRTIVQFTEGRNDDIYIPYLALNYYDRYVSRNPMPAGRPTTVTAICCLILASKMRDPRFKLTPFLTNEKLEERMGIRLQTVLLVEMEIFEGLGWRLNSITPFSFLNYYYPRYKQLGGFKCRSIVEIIIKAQADNRLVRYTHSEIASSCLLAGAALVYTREFLIHFLSEVESAPSLPQLMQLCGIQNTVIERAESSRPDAGEASTSQVASRPDTGEASTSQVARRPEEVASTSQNVHDSPTSPDDQACSRRPGNEVASDRPTVIDEREISRRAGRGLTVSDSSAVTDERRISRRSGKEVASDRPTAIDEREILRRAGRGLTVSDSSAVTDERRSSRRPGKEVASDRPTVIDEREILSRQGRGLTVSDSSAVTAEGRISRRPGKEVAYDRPTVIDEREILRRAGRGLTVSDSSAVTDERRISRRPGKEVAYDRPTVIDEREILRRQGRGLTVSDSSAVTDERRISRRPGKEVAYDRPTVIDEREILRRQGRGLTVSDSSAVTDERRISRRPGKEVAYDRPTVIDEREILRRQGRGLTVSDSSAVTDERRISRRPSVSRRRAGRLLTISETDPSEVEDEQEISRSPGKEEPTISQADRSAIPAEQDISRSPGMEVLTIPQTHPSAVTEEQDISETVAADEQENPISVTPVALPTEIALWTADQVAPTSLVDPSEVIDKQETPTSVTSVALPTEIALWTAEQVESTSLVDPSEVIDERETPPRPRNAVAFTLQEKPTRAETEEETMRLVRALDAAPEAALKAALGETNENQQNLVGASQRFAQEVDSARSSVQSEASQRFTDTLESVFAASQRPSTRSDQSVISELDSSRRSIVAKLMSFKIDPPEKKNDPTRPGSSQVASTSQVDPSDVTGEQEETRRLVSDIDAALESGLKAALDEMNETQRDLFEASGRVGQEVELARSSLQNHPPTSDIDQASLPSQRVISEFEEPPSSVLYQRGISGGYDKSGSSSGATHQPPAAVEIETPQRQRNDRFNRNNCCNIL